MRKNKEKKEFKGEEAMRLEKWEGGSHIRLMKSGWFLKEDFGNNWGDGEGRMGVLNISDKWGLMGKKRIQGCEGHVNK